MYQSTLFDGQQTRPLASRMRPEELDEFAGQQHLLGPGKVLRQMIDQDRVTSMIFWGPPGVGKTTLARIIARRTKAEFIDFSAVTSGIKEIKAVMQTAEDSRRFGGKTILFVDEIHRFNKAQQDAFLPYVERGSIILIGATTENPSFEINSALLSRCKVFVLQALTAEDLEGLLRRAVTDPRGFGNEKVNIAPELLHAIAVFANGDARTALNTLEMAVLNGRREHGEVTVEKELLEQCTSKKSLLYDKNGEEHYNLISALHKSMRNSDPDAAVYWLARMLEAGEDPLYVARRLIRFASEDVGMADSRALEITVAAYQACHFLGMPECRRGGLYVFGAPVQFPVCGLRGGQKGRLGPAGLAGTPGDPQRPHQAHGPAALRRGLPVCPRCPRTAHRYAVPARQPGGKAVLPPHRPGQRGPGRRPAAGHPGLEGAAPPGAGQKAALRREKMTPKPICHSRGNFV